MQVKLGIYKDTLFWEPVETAGHQPPPRANHSSAVLGNKIFIFGGWDGCKRLNDLHYLEIGTEFSSL